MGKVLAGITISVDGFITGPRDGPGCGPGVGGERLHYWVFGGPWSYDSPGRGEPAGEDKAWLEETMAANGAVIAGRGTYEAAGDLVPPGGHGVCSLPPGSHVDGPAEDVLQDRGHRRRWRNEVFARAERLCRRTHATCQR
jgi:dihydrofolate reductase